MSVIISINKSNSGIVQILKMDRFSEINVKRIIKKLYIADAVSIAN